MQGTGTESEAGGWAGGRSSGPDPTPDRALPGDHNELAVVFLWLFHFKINTSYASTFGPRPLEICLNSRVVGKSVKKNVKKKK